MSDGCIKTQGNMVDWLKKAVFIPVILILVSVGSVGAVTSITSCGTLGNAGETYVLQNDISTSGTCFTIGADNITLDGAGYSITGDRSGYGVYLNGRSGVTVKNLNVSGFNQGIHLFSSSNNTITNNIANFNSYGGIFLSSSSNYNTLTNNTASNNNDGIGLYSSSNNTLTGNAMNSNTDNFYLFGSQDSHFNNSIDTSNTVDGKPIYYVRNTANIVYNNSTNAGTFYCIWCDNVTIKDLTLTKNMYGVFFWSTNNSKIENVNASNNTYGIYLFSSSSSNITNNTASDNSYGIYLYSSSNNTITNNTASNNRYGIFLYSSSNYNTLTNNTANSNTQYGIHLKSSSNYNTLTNNNASNNVYGIELWKSSNNTITNNTVTSNNNRGIWLTSFSNYNLIYNNLFNNTANYRFYGTVYANTWNTTKTPGPNIIGGPYLGGNFWAKPDGTGFSETCTDADRDGICDSGYTLASGNVDYLPLSTPPVLYVTTTVIQRLDYRFNITWTIPPDPDLEEFNTYQRLNDNSSTDTLIDTVPANYTQPYVAGPGYDDGNLYQYMVTPVNTSGSEGSGAYAPKGGPAPPIPFAPLGTLLTLGSGLAAYLWYRRKVI